MTVTPFQSGHVERVADLHCRTLGGLLTALGPKSAAAFYSGYVASPACIAYVEEQGGVLRGFVLGSGDPERMRKDALRANRGSIGWAVAARVLRQPSLLRLVLDGARGLRPDEAGGFDPRAPELTYIAVREDARGAGVGSALLDAFHAALRAQGFEEYELSVEADNAQAVAFYESRGLRQTGTYRQFGTTYRRYVREIAWGTRSA